MENLLWLQPAGVRFTQPELYSPADVEGLRVLAHDCDGGVLVVRVRQECELRKLDRHHDDPVLVLQK